MNELISLQRQGSGGELTAAYGLPGLAQVSRGHREGPLSDAAPFPRAATLTETGRVQGAVSALGAEARPLWSLQRAPFTQAGLLP